VEPQAEETVSSRRIWVAIISATVIEVIAYGFLLFAILASASDIPESAGPPLALGLILVPFVFVALAFISKRKRAPIATLRAMGIWVLVLLPVGLLNPIMGLTAAFGVGGIVTLRRGPSYRLSYRVWAVVITTVYVTGLLFFAPPGGVFAGAVMPFPALGVADMLAERRAKAGAEEGAEPAE
jgi:hypothetical protein